MELSPEERTLASGTADEIDDLVDCDRCVIVDWRADPEEVIAAFQQFLPPGHLRTDYIDEEEIVIAFGTRAETIPLASEAVAIPLANALKQRLRPEHEAYLFRDCLDSDTACYFVRPASWWQTFRLTYPERFAVIFTEEDHH